MKYQMLWNNEYNNSNNDKTFNSYCFLIKDAWYWSAVLDRPWSFFYFKSKVKNKSIQDRNDKTLTFKKSEKE